MRVKSRYNILPYLLTIRVVARIVSRYGPPHNHSGLMKTIKITIINKLGLHARASAKFVSTAAKYQSQIDVTKDSKTINGKSIMGVMLLAANKGSELILNIDGPDEDAMEKALVDLINNYFGEDE